MKKSPLKNIVDVLQNSSLSRVVQKANSLAMINQKVQQTLPQSYRGLYRIANLVDNCLIIEVQNATIRHGLQLQQGALLHLIQVDFPNINGLIFKVNPSFHS